MMIMALMLLVGDWVGSMADFLDLSVESSVLIGVVVHNAFGAIRLVQRIRALDIVSIAVFPGLLVVTGMGILDSVSEFVGG